MLGAPFYFLAGFVGAVAALKTSAVEPAWAVLFVLALASTIAGAIADYADRHP